MNLKSCPLGLMMESTVTLALLQGMMINQISSAVEESKVSIESSQDRRFILNI